MNKYQILVLIILLGVVAFLIFGLKDGGTFGAIDVPLNLFGTSSLATVTSSFGGGSGLVFPGNSGVSVRQFQNLCDQGIQLSFATSGPIIRGQGGFLVRASSSIEMTAENGSLHRGDVYASSTGACTSNLRLYQY